MRQDHPNTNDFKCTKCKNIYSTKENLLSHISEHHGKSFNCDSCEMTFKSERELEIHDSQDHTNNYDCDKCDHQVTSEILLNKHMKAKHSSDLKECKGVGSNKCGKNFQSYNDLMEHRRDEHNSGNKVCRYFKDGTCYFMNEEKGGCWYLHTNEKIHLNQTQNEFDCKSCNKIFKSKSEVMNHRKEKHEDEVPLCNDIKDGKVCSRRRCWFSHRKALSAPTVNSKNIGTSKNTTSNSSIDQGFWQPLQSSRPPDQMDQMMIMITKMMAEINQIKENFQHLSRE